MRYDDTERMAQRQDLPSLLKRAEREWQQAENTHDQIVRNVERVTSLPDEENYDAPNYKLQFFEWDNAAYFTQLGAVAESKARLQRARARFHLIRAAIDRRTLRKYGE